jgi:CRP-like cAMP-binding protein
MGSFTAKLHRRHQEASMNPAMKFAAHERGSARTLVMVPGNRRAVAETVAASAPTSARVSSNGGTMNGNLREAGTALIERPIPTEHHPIHRDTPSARTVATRGGQKLFGPGGGGGAVYLVRTGCVALYKSLPGRRSICVGLLGPGDVFQQESSKHGVNVTGVSAEVLSDATIAIFDLEALPRLMSSTPELAATIVAGYSQRLTAVQGLVEQLLSRDITLRLASVLLVLADRFGEMESSGFAAISLPMPHKLLARLIGANRVTVTRVITEFRASGLADSHGRNQISVDPVKALAYVRNAGLQYPSNGRD